MPWKKQKFARLIVNKKLDSSSKDMKAGEEEDQSDIEVISKTLEKLKPSPLLEATTLLEPAVVEPIVTEIPIVLEVIIPKASQASTPVGQPTSSKATATTNLHREHKAFGEGSGQSSQLVMSRVGPHRATGASGIPIPRP
ncbi:hypothetical protein C1H46_010355 [Malus baccata]|uniref:Uncharacterized protein n=1 Tax=Malus baccata TaxID=106549 RepID=A0A540MYY0_MALBA|nr:hypothetical protein C1H46_010355 [Malus baccata]